MVYVLIVLGLAVVIAPLMSAMPSKSQRAKAALRDQARACNLRVSPPVAGDTTAISLRVRR